MKKFKVVIIISVIVTVFLLFDACCSIFSCSYCTDDGFNPCENCTDGTVICENCEGNMIVECNNCNEEFKEKCTNCNGSGNGKQYTEKCFTCGGNGALQFECSNCNGKGWVYARLTPTKCMQCNGSGNGEVRDCPVCKNGIATIYEDCESCDGKGYGKDDCTKCNKTKEIECESCLGKGCISCPECDGTQKIPCEYCNANHTNTTTADD